jgi:periplasmic copper chaperone A
MKRLTLITVAVLAAMLALAGSAFAHVTVSAPGAAPGASDQQITFRVPVEQDVDTVAFTVQLPLDTPIAGVDVLPVPGWTHTQKTSTLATPIKTDDGDITTAVSQITWTAAAGQGLKPGEYGEFTIIAGQLPDAKTLTFKALQTYRGGAITRWIEVAAPGSTEEPEHPAPVLSLAADTAAGTLAASGSTGSAAADHTHDTASSSPGGVTLFLAILALLAGIGGVVLGWRANRRTVSS